MALLPTPSAGKVLLWSPAGTLINASVSDLLDLIAASGPTTNKYYLDITDVSASLVAISATGSLGVIAVTTPQAASAALVALSATGSLGAVTASAGVAASMAIAAIQGTGSLGDLLVTTGATKLSRSDNFNQWNGAGYPAYSSAEAMTIGAIRALNGCLYISRANTAGGTSPTATGSSSYWRGYLGANWLPSGVEGVAAYSRGVQADQSNGHAGSQVNMAQSYWAADTFSPDQYSEITPSGFYTGTNRAALAVVRSSPLGSNPDCYAVACTSSAVYIHKYLNDVLVGAAALAQTSRTMTVGDVIRLEASGTGATVTLTAKVNGTTVLTTTDSAADRILTGAPGIKIYGTNQPLYQADSWAGGDL